MNNDVKIAVVGCGYWGTNHARTLSDWGALAAVSDLNSDNADKIPFKTPVVFFSKKIPIFLNI